MKAFRRRSQSRPVTVGARGILYLFVFYLFLIGPVAVIVIVAFSSDSHTSFPPSGFSFRWFKEFVANDAFVVSFIFSSQLAFVVAAVSGIIGVSASYALWRHPGRWSAKMEMLVMSPLFAPEILIGMALLVSLSAVSFNGSALSLIAAHSLICLPHVARNTTVGLNGFDRRCIDAARVLGARPLRVFMKVVFRNIAPSVISGVSFAIVLSFSNIYMALFLAGPDTVTLPLRIFNYMEYEDTPLVAAVSTIQMLFMAVLFSMMSLTFATSVSNRNRRVRGKV